MGSDIAIWIADRVLWLGGAVAAILGSWLAWLTTRHFGTDKDVTEVKSDTKSIAESLEAIEGKLDDLQRDTTKSYQDLEACLHKEIEGVNNKINGLDDKLDKQYKDLDNKSSERSAEVFKRLDLFKTEVNDKLFQLAKDDMAGAK